MSQLSPADRVSVWWLTEGAASMFFGVIILENLMRPGIPPAPVNVFQVRSGANALFLGTLKLHPNTDLWI